MDDAEIPIGLKALAAELDALGGVSNGPTVDALPDLEGSDFRPLALIGRGGMGEVYVARQVSLDREVAVKVLSPTLAHDGEFRARFLAEARTIARLHHPNIVQTIAAGEANGRLYFAMERIEGETTAEHRFGYPEEMVRCGIRVAEALAYAHACGVVHRDVKPSNIFIGSKDAVKLGDFGLAGLAGDHSYGRSGTKKYMAPEQHASGKADAKSDQYSFGVTMLELAAPFPELLRNRDFAAILSKATAEDPEARYPGMTTLVSDLGRFLRHEPVAARPAGFVHVMRLGARRNPAAAIAIGLTGISLVALIAALAIGYWRTARALSETERARAETVAALTKVEGEAGQAARALATTLTTIDRTSKDVRANEIGRAISSVKALAERFPENKEIKAALDRLEYARDAHAKLKARHGDDLRPRVYPSPSQR